MTNVQPIEVDGVDVFLGSHHVVKRLSVVFEPGAVTALVGPNGAGKTTLLRALGGDLAISGGEVRHAGRRVDPTADEWKRLTAFVSDSDELFPELSAEEHLRLAAALFEINPEHGVARADALLELAGLSDRRAVPAEELSAGMRKRLSVILGLIHAPQALFFDEPLNALDFQSAETFFSLLEFLRSAGRIVVFSAHSVAALVRVADIVVEMQGGEVAGHTIVDEGAREELPSRLRGVAEVGHSALRPDALAWLQ